MSMPETRARRAQVRVRPAREEDAGWPSSRDLVAVLTPFGEPSPRIVTGAVRAGALGLLDLGRNGSAARDALEAVVGSTYGRFGVRVPASCPLEVADLPDAVDTVLVAEAASVPAWRSGKAEGGEQPAARRVLAEVRSAEEAEEALAAGADGLVVKGTEAGGAVGSVGASVLSQQVLKLTERPVWVMGGIGPHTAAAAVTAGAVGVVVDSQTALLNEARLPRLVRAAVAAMDGSETRVVAGHRVYTRPDLWVAELDDDTTAEDLVPRLGATDLASQALPVGQDAALASGFADRYRTVGRLVQGLREAIVQHQAAAREAAPLGPGRGVCATTGTAYPVVQGPMTRVSDRPAFAEAVADAGGLPFLALALMRRDEVRPLLEETAALLSGRPWGVGVLGFVPKELREEQLEVIDQIRPPFALIAGGRPAQAVALEEAGTKTFLHVPAPGLLQRFLKDGARRFVFEGFECGGHVGPRSSFTLWEAQLAVLEEWALRQDGRLDELDLLFAGGIHDGRSAAMVAALAGPLAQAGARVGVLLGTAYLFTEQAVAAGAIGEEFQAKAVDCERTALLESGPGHVTRCAETSFVETFRQTRRELVARGADAETRWAELETLNLGRLRVASKGLRRDGDELVEVDREEQDREGMFMLGDVATLRSERSSIDQLHQSVSTGATAWLEAAAGEAATGERSCEDADHGTSPPPPVDVAVVGMSCIMPGARDVDELWANIVSGVNSITEVPPERWDVGTYFDPEWDHATAHAREGSASKWGGFLPDVDFDALAYGIPPSSLSAIEPSQLLALKVAADALEDAGLAGQAFPRDRTSVIFGAEGGTDQSVAHGFRALFPTYVGPMPEELAAWLPKISEDSFPGLLPNVIAGRVANRLDLGGRNMTVDAACASSLAALDAACAELASGHSDVVLAGGVDLHNGIQDYLLFTSVHALSTTGQCRTFDASADGITLGEGVACVVLKRVEDAERDGDRIYAVIKAVAASSDGRSLGLTAPRPLGQERALRRAYAQAAVDMDEVGLVEAHGTGTVVGDRTELVTLTEVFSGAGMSPGSCVVGSVKSNIGHTKCAAGLAGLIKAAKAVYHGVLPPTLHVSEPNQGWDARTSPFAFLGEARPWPAERRVAGVSAFGFGGTNFHTVLTSHDDGPPRRGVAAWPAELFVFRGDAEEVARALDDLHERLGGTASTAAGPAFRLRDVAAAVSCRTGRGPVRVALVADDLDDLRTKVAHAREGRPVPGVYLAGPDRPGESGPPKVAFLFPGQGSQRPGMAGDLFTTFGETRHLLDLGARASRAGTVDLLRTMLPPGAFGENGVDGQRRALMDTRVAQPALGLADLAAAEVLAGFGVRPDMLGGHSYGELVALCVAGSFDERTLLDLSSARAEAILDAAGEDPGGMVAVAAPRQQVEAALVGSDVVAANENHPDQVVVAGPSRQLEDVAGRLKAEGFAAKRLPVACAFHSPVVAGAADTLADHLAGREIRSPEIDVFSNLTAGVYPAEADEVRALLAGQVANPVRFADQVRAMYDAGARVFVEVGPGQVLTGCVERILERHADGGLTDRALSPEQSDGAVVVAVDRPGDHGVRSLLHALAQMAVAGVPVDIPELFEDRGVDPARWSAPAVPAAWVVNGHLVRTREGEVVPGGLRPADSVPAVGSGAVEIPVPSRPGTNGGSNGGGAFTREAVGGAGRDQVLAEYFRTAHQIIESGHTLLLDYLGVERTEPVRVPAVGAGVPDDGRGGDLAAAGTSLPAGGAQPGSGGHNGDRENGQASTAPVSVAEALGSPEELLARLTAIVSSRTGYPEDVLGPDLDVEADLSIDSIKRLEILSELADQIGLGEDGALAELEHLVEELASRKTLRSIVGFLFENAGLLGAAEGDSSSAGDLGSSDDPGRRSGGADTDPADLGARIPPTANRFEVVLTDAPLADPGTGPRYLPVTRVTGDGPLAEALEAELRVRGLEVGRIPTSRPAADRDGDEPHREDLTDVDLLVVTDLLDGLDLTELYRRVRAWLLSTGCDVVVAAPFGGGLGIDPPVSTPRSLGEVPDPHDRGALPAGAGARGLIKTAALEFPDRQIRLVDFSGAAEVGQVATALADDVLQADGPVEVGWAEGRRRAPALVPVTGTNGSGRQGGLPLGPDSVVLLTGGARGITSRVGVALAERSGCHLHLVGRTAWPDGPERPELAACLDRSALRAELVRQAGRGPGGTEPGAIDPRAIEKACDGILAAREMRQVEADLAATGADFTYHQLDVRDRPALGALLEAIYERHGRLDGIVHGAGVLDDHLIADKPPEAFERVFAIKAGAAETLLTGVREATGRRGCPAPSFVVLFGSIAGVCGNRGQADYAAANDALDLLARANADVASRVLTLDWGPWSTAAGMVSDSLARLFEESGMGLIDLDDGVAVLLDELAVAGDGAAVPGRPLGTPGSQVVVARCGAELLSVGLTGLAVAGNGSSGR